MKKILVVGSLNVDFVAGVTHIPKPGETILADRMTVTPGGKGANQAFAAAKLGGNIAMLGAVGSDTYGAMLLESLRSVGVDVSGILVDEGDNTGMAWISVSETGENSIVVISGANRSVTTAYIDEHMDALRDCDIVIMQLEIPLDTVRYVAQKAKELGKTVILDPAPAVKTLGESLFACIDIVKPNETELAILVDNENALADVAAAARKIAERGAKNVVVTLGSNGAFLLNDRGEALEFPVGAPVDVVDSTAAGDSFTAAVALQLAKGKCLEEAIPYAMRVAEITITRKGAQISIPTEQEVAERLEMLL